MRETEIRRLSLSDRPIDSATGEAVRTSIREWKNMEFRKVLALRGPNVWANFPVLEAWVDLGALKDSPSDSLPGFNDRLMAWLPSMIEHRCSIGERGGFFERLRRGTYPAHILEHITIELQTLAGAEVGFGKARETSEEGVYRVVVEYEDETLARACLAEARELQLAAIENKPYDVAATIKRLKSLAQEVCLGPSTGAIVKAAKARGIPTRRLNEGSLVLLGYGAKQRRIWTAETDRTSAIAQDIAQDKDLTRSLLRSVGVPVPEGRPVSDAADAWEAAEDIGVPVVVKPRYGNHGRGVSTNLMNKEQVEAAYQAAAAESSSIVVEKYAPGEDYRLLVVGDRLVAAARRVPAHVVGNGVHTIEQLIEIANADPRRGDDHSLSLSKIHLDEIGLQVISEQGYKADSVPPSGQRVIIRRNANLSTGGTAIDVTDQVHPEVAARAVEAAKVIGLDVAGVDVLAINISRPLEEQGGIVCEVNAGPGLRMHLDPSIGTPRPVGEAIVDTLFARGETGRIPVVAVTGTNGKTTTTRFIAHILRSSGKRVGMTCTEGIFIENRRIETGDCSGPQSARSVLLNPMVDAGVFETARGGILREGLAFDRCDVAVVTNIDEGDHLGVGGIDTPEQLAKVKRCIVEVVPPGGHAVLKADDPLVAAMAEKCKGGVIYFSVDPDNAVIRSHLANSGKAVFVRDGSIVLAEGAKETPVAKLTEAPLTHQGRIRFQVENTLASVAAAWSLGVELPILRVAVQTFSGKLEHAPGRFNLLEIDGATVILDYGHNVSALSALLEAVVLFPHQRRIVVYSAAGDRRDEDLIRQGEMLGNAFDQVILYEDHYKRGRADGEIMGLFRKGLSSGKRVSAIQEVRGALRSVEAALDLVRPGDLLVIQPDVIDETINFVQHYLHSRAPGREISLSEALVARPTEPASAPSPATIPMTPTLPADPRFVLETLVSAVMPQAQAFG